MSGVGLGGRESDLTIPNEVWFGHHDKASSTCMTLLSTPSAEGTVSRSIWPAALRGALRRPRWTTYISKVELAVWRRPARAVCQVLMTNIKVLILLCASRGRHETCPASRVEAS